MFDQLNYERGVGNIFYGFEEEEISFLPTYKYDKKSDMIDTSAKHRCPSWTDRILFSSSKLLQIKNTGNYRSINCRTSDHRPVMTVLNCSLLSGDQN